MNGKQKSRKKANKAVFRGDRLHVSKEIIWRWNRMKAEQSMKSNNKFATALLDVWTKRCSSCKHTQQGGTSSMSKYSLPSVNKYPGCSVQGLPVLSPFKSAIVFPEDAPKFDTELSDMFVVVPYDTRQDNLDVAESDCQDEESVQMKTDEESVEDQELDDIDDNENLTEISVKEEDINVSRNDCDSKTDGNDDTKCNLAEEYNADTDMELADKNIKVDMELADKNIKVEAGQKCFSDELSEEELPKPVSNLIGDGGVTHNIDDYDCDTDVETIEEVGENNGTNFNMISLNTSAANKTRKKRLKRCDRKSAWMGNDDIVNVKKKEKVPKSAGSTPNKVLKRRKNGTSKKALKKLRLQKPRVAVKLEEHTDKYTVETFLSHEQKNRGRQIYEDLYSCTVCNSFKAGNQTEFENHIEEHINGDLTCIGCNYISSTKQALSKHMLNCKGDSEELISMRRICDICDKVTLSRDTYLTHLGSDHHQLVFKCKFCDESFSKKNYLRKHKAAIHTEETRYCNTCDRFYTALSVEELYEHVKSCSNTVPCHLCGKLFSTKCGGSSLKQHLVEVHSNIRAHPCHLCNYAAKTKVHLKRHLRVHEGDNPYHCDQCTFTCVQRYQLTSHLRTHTGEKPFKCDMCNYAAAWNVQLKDHKKAHGLTTAVTCQECGIVFKNANSLNLHLKKGH